MYAYIKSTLSCNIKLTVHINILLSAIQTANSHNFHQEELHLLHYTRKIHWAVYPLSYFMVASMAIGGIICTIQDYFAGEYFLILWKCA